MVKSFWTSALQYVADAFFLCRPVLLVPVWVFCIFGYFSGTVIKSGFSVSAIWLAPISVYAWIFVFSLSVGAVYVLNQINDKKVDALNAGFALLIKGKIPLWIAWLTTIILSCLSIILPMIYIPGLVLWSCCSLVLGIVYCIRLLYFTGRPILDFTTNAIGYGVVSFGVGWCLSGQTVDLHFIKSCVPYFFMMCAGSISSTLPDFKGDKQAGKNTTAAVLGLMNAHYLSMVFLVMASVEAYSLRDWVALTCVLGSFPFYTFFALRKESKIAIETTYKGGYVVCMVVSCIIFPTIAFATLLIFALTVWYFRKRHNILYPSLLPVQHD